MVAVVGKVPSMYCIYANYRKVFRLFYSNLNGKRRRRRYCNIKAHKFSHRFIPHTPKYTENEWFGVWCCTCVYMVCVQINVCV